MNSREYNYVVTLFTRYSKNNKKLKPLYLISYRLQVNNRQ